MRPDANLRYLYTGGKKKGRDRPKVLDGKVNCKQIDKRRFKEFFRDKHTVCYIAKVYCVILKKMVRIVYIQDIKTLRHELLMCTDTGLSPQKILDYYRLRFQIEFLFRDAKQYAGLEDCQARSYKKLSFHFNMALSAVSTAKAAVWWSLKPEKREEFSMRTIKTMYHNKLIADRIFSNLGLELNCRKIKQIYEQCIYTGITAA